MYLYIIYIRKFLLFTRFSSFRKMMSDQCWRLCCTLSEGKRNMNVRRPAVTILRESLQKTKKQLREIYQVFYLEKNIWKKWKIEKLRETNVKMSEIRFLTRMTLTAVCSYPTYFGHTRTNWVLLDAWASLRTWKKMKHSYTTNNR